MFSTPWVNSPLPQHTVHSQSVSPEQPVMLQHPVQLVSESLGLPVTAAVQPHAVDSYLTRTRPLPPHPLHSSGGHRPSWLCAFPWRGNWWWEMAQHGRQKLHWKTGEVSLGFSVQEIIQKTTTSLTKCSWNSTYRPVYSMIKQPIPLAKCTQWYRQKITHTLMDTHRPIQANQPVTQPTK